MLYNMMMLSSIFFAQRDKKWYGLLKIKNFSGFGSLNIKFIEN